MAAQPQGANPGRRLVVVGAVLLVTLVSAVTARTAIVERRGELKIVHWANSHPLREGLLEGMAETFNRAGHRSPSGRTIRVEIVPCDSAVQAADLTSRSTGGTAGAYGCKGKDGSPAGAPTIVTPQSSDWLVDVNHRVGHDVVDLASSEALAESWLGIVTYRAMAECLGWPTAPVGYADILRLREAPQGWAAHPDCARTEWGKRPLLAFTNPNTSTSGRNVLVSMYASAAGKAPADLTVADVERPDVVAGVRRFQRLVDHYLPGTLQLNTKVAQGVRYGHFFLMPEDNLVSLRKGNEKAIGADGAEKAMRQVGDLVMIYPEEGAVLNDNPAGIVTAPWVTDESADAASAWVSFVRQDAQQRRFMAAGFRPAAGTTAKIDESRFTAWGLDARHPTATLEPADLAPDVLERIIGSWGSVKNPAVVTLVVDVSGSMAGPPLVRVKEGLTRLLDQVAGPGVPGATTSLGLVAFADDINVALPPAPLADAKYEIADAIDQLETKGGTALFDAVARALALTDAAVADPEATRAVVVLSDGAATAGRACLHDLITMRSRDETGVRDFCGKDGDLPRDDHGRPVLVEDVVGESLSAPHLHDLQIFFVGFGEADVAIGRLLAQATGAEYTGSTDDDLAAVIEALSGYF